jgi:hypothetical protein
MIQTAAELPQMLTQLPLLRLVQQLWQQMMVQHARGSSALQRQQVRQWQQHRQVAELLLVAAGRWLLRLASSCW